MPIGISNMAIRVEKHELAQSCLAPRSSRLAEVRPTQNDSRRKRAEATKYVPLFIDKQGTENVKEGTSILLARVITTSDTLSTKLTASST
jgi:hypothetical protein